MKLAPPSPLNSLMGAAWVAVFVLAIIWATNNVGPVGKLVAAKPKKGA